MQRMCDHALNLAYQGFAVFPLHTINARWDLEPEYRCTCKDSKTDDGCNAPGKHPMWEKGTLERGLKDATRNFEQIEKWWAKWPNANIGIPTGNINSLFVIDIDGAKGRGSLKELQGKCGKLPPTLTARTGNGGHLFFRSGGRAYQNRTGILPGIDIRGDGGYIVAPPSVHFSGKRYGWTGNGKLTDPPEYIRELLISGVPSWEQRLHRSKPAPYTGPDKPKPHKDPHYTGDDKERFIDVIPNGDRHNTLLKLAARWKWEGRNTGEIRDLLIETNRMKCKPPAPRKMLKDIWEYSEKSWRVES